MPDITDVSSERIVEVKEEKSNRLKRQNEAVNFSRLMSKVDNERLTRTLVLEARTDIRLVARLEQYFLSQHVLVNTRSELVRAGLELLHDWLVIQGKIEPLDTMTYHDAYDTLARFGNLHKAGQNRRKLAASLARETFAVNYQPSVNLPDLNSQELPEEYIAQQQAISLQRLRDAGALAEPIRKPRRGSDEDMRIDQGYEDLAPDSASLLIRPATVDVDE